MDSSVSDYPKSVVRDGMHIDWDVPIEMDDGVTLRADVYRPPEDGSNPVLLTYGPYGKWKSFIERYDAQWKRLREEHPEVTADTSNEYISWELPDPERWVPDGYALVRIDSRGTGRSPGHVDVWSPRETDDLAACIDWAGQRDWSNGKVGLTGISYFAMNQWQVAARDPDHLEAICAWEGAADFYRDLAHHGGIYCDFAPDWYERRIPAIQHGLGSEGERSHLTGDWISGPENLTPEEREANRSDLDEEFRSNKLASDEYWTSRSPDWSAVDVPFLSAGNWGGHGLHARGNFEAFMRAASDQKWLEVHGLEHWTHFYTDYGLDLQKRFFGHFLKGEDTGWEEQPSVRLQVRRPGEEFVERHEDEWPLARTDWTRYHLDANGVGLATERPTEAGSVTYDALGDGVTFLTDPLPGETEITGPISAKLFVSSDTEDADLFLVVRLFDSDLSEVTFQGALDPHKPIAMGWLRASHRKLDPDLSTEWRPYHTHDEVQPLEPGEVYEVDVEIWPTCVVAPPGTRLGLSVRGTDYEYPVEPDGPMEEGYPEFTGSGPFLHTDARDRPPEVYGGDVTVYTGGDHPSSVLLPLIPATE